MSSQGKRRYFYSTILFCLGGVAAQVTSFWWFPSASLFLHILITIAGTLLAAAAGYFLQTRLGLRSSRRLDGERTGEIPAAQMQQYQAEIAQLNQRHQEELKNLSSELAFQLEKHEQVGGRQQVHEDRFGELADHVQEGLAIYENGHLVFINQQACAMFGDCPEETLEKRVQKYACEGELQRLQPVLDRCAGPDDTPCELTYWIQGGDGVQRCIREYYSKVRSNDLERTIVVSSDITEQVLVYQNLEKAVEDRTLELSTVLEVSKRIATTLELEPLLNLILDQIETILPYSGAAIFTLEGDLLEVVACHVPSLSMPKRAITLSLERMVRYLPVIREKKVIILDDVHGSSPLALAFQESYPQSGFTELPHARSWIGIPLVIRDKVMGLLSLTHSNPGYYTQTHARLAQSISYQVAIAIENARLYEKAQNLAALEERNRIARELHDSVTQLLYGITLYCTASTRTLKHGNLKQVEQNLVEIKENALQALQEMRLLILELNPPLLQKEGLVKALAASLEMIETRTGLETELKTNGLDQFPHTIEPGLYRIAMEALNNLVRYARAKKVIVDIQQMNHWVFLEIRDNGVGFDLRQAKTSSGMGLQNMEERARQLGGRLEIQTTPGSGTCIRAEVPF